ncbi:ATP-binding protein [Candidatus Woesearchaeota archaeon]|nr:ATP-binding protein [Candidatus Woesearchaeota archaeon]
MVKIIGFTGGKGGTGKSTIATAVAYELAKNKKVLLVDADVDCPNDHLLLSIKRNLLKNIEQRIPKWELNKCTKCGLCGTVCKTNAIVSIKDRNPIFMKQQCNGCGSCVVKCPEDAISWSKKEIGQVFTGKNYNIELLSGELKSSEPVSEFIVNSLNEIITGKKSKYDYVIVDTAAGTHCPVIAALEMCDYVFTVTEPTPLGKHDSEIILKLLDILRIRSKIVLNRSDIGKKEIITKLAKSYKLSIVCEIPYSKTIVNSYAKGMPIKDKQILKILEVIRK